MTQIGELVLDAAAHRVYVDGVTVQLTPAEFRILAALCESPGQVFTRSQLLDRLSDGGSIYERTLDRHINNLRKKIEPSPRDPQYVQTVYGVGYRVRRP